MFVSGGARFSTLHDSHSYRGESVKFTRQNNTAQGFTASNSERVEGIDRDAYFSDAKHGPIQHGWSPYVNNGGTVMGLAGTNPDGTGYALLAADTRMSNGYSIMSRNVPKLFKLTSTCVLASSGMQADIMTLVKTLRSKLVVFQHLHGYEMPCESMAQLLSNTLYYRRFFPYYTFNVLGGLDKDGEGVVYTYDAIGNFECTQGSVSGTGQSLIQPVLDNQIAQNNQLIKRDRPLNQEEALDLLKDAFTSAGERDIYTGDKVEIYVMNSKGISFQSFDLKKD